MIPLPCPLGISGPRDDVATVDPAGFDAAVRAVSKETGAEGVVGIRLFTAHRGHGEIGVPRACRLSGARRGLPGVSPGKEGEGPAANPTQVELAEEFVRLRMESLALLSKIGEDDLNRTARHQELGTVTLGEMIHEWAGHDLMHTVQGERAILQPFIDGCGPWKRYFSDHTVAPSPRET